MESRNISVAASSRKEEKGFPRDIKEHGRYQWLHLAIYFGGLLALGTWTVTTYKSKWAEAGVWGRNGYKSEISNLGKPWGEVSMFVLMHSTQNCWLRQAQWTSLHKIAPAKEAS